LKRAGIVGGVTWSVPVMQTVLAPAASASAGAVIGDPCSPDGVTCGDSSICYASVCGAMGASCATGPCFASACSPTNVPQPSICGGIRATCTSDAECLSSGCDGGRCKGGAGAVCSKDDQCYTSEGCCRAGDPGCTIGTCRQSKKNKDCRTNADCLNGNCLPTKKCANVSP
jgi:hypothetical protein